MPAITLAIGDITVRNHNGLFSLNDLHKASGGEAKHQPAFFMRRKETRALVAELEASPEMGTPSANSQTPIQTINDGANNGTYACRELVIAYAAWINAAFHLKVIRVFLAVATPQPEPIQPRLDYDRISPSQAQDLKELVQSIVEAGIQSHGETWARLHRKFRVNSYLQLPATQHLEARQYLLGKLPCGYAATAQRNHLPPTPPGKVLVDLSHLASIYTDLGKLRRRVDALAMPAQDTPPSWWQQQAISA
jgi:hypothetical protein